MAQELQSQALAFGGARNQSRHIGDGVSRVAGDNDAEIRHQRGEWVVGDLRLGGAHRRNQGRLSGRGETDQRHVGDGLQFQNHVALFTEFAEQGEAGGAAGLVGQGDVAEAAGTALGDNAAVALVAQVGELCAGMLGFALFAARLKDDGAAGYGQNQILALGAVLIIAQAHGAAAGDTMRHETIVEQAGGVTVGHEHHGTAVAAIAAVWTGQRLVFLTTDAGRTVAPIAALDMDGYSIHKITHIDYLTKKPRPYGRGLKKLDAISLRR